MELITQKFFAGLKGIGFYSVNSSFNAQLYGILAGAHI